MIHHTRLSRMLEGARNYAAGEKSDPFTLARAMAHIANGVADVSQNGDDRFYKADPAQEQRYLPNGEQYSVTVYRNMQRP